LSQWNMYNTCTKLGIIWARWLNYHIGRLEN
jgi:hypothetical protein